MRGYNRLIRGRCQLAIEQLAIEQLGTAFMGRPKWRAKLSRTPRQWLGQTANP